MSDQPPQELHEVIERRLLGPYKVALLLDNGSLVLMDSEKGTQTVLDAGAADTLLDLLSGHKDFLRQFTQPGNQAAKQAHEDWANDE